jgi:CheY-like chemotaxis protein
MPPDPTPQNSLILLVEDNEDDVYLIKRAIDRAAVTNPLRVLRTGDQAIAYLQGGPPCWNRAEHPLPAMVLLDIKMPVT